MVIGCDDSWVCMQRDVNDCLTCVKACMDAVSVSMDCLVVQDDIIKRQRTRIDKLEKLLYMKGILDA